MSLKNSDKSITVKYKGATEILCDEHDYRKFPGLNEDLIKTANEWKGGGWDDIKVNVSAAKGTQMIVEQPIVQQLGEAHYETVILAQHTVNNESSEAIQESIQLKGSFTNTMTSTVESEMSIEVARQFGVSLEFVSASGSLTISGTKRKGQSETSSDSLEFTRTVNLNVPPDKGFVVKMTALVEKRKVQVTLPSKIEGPFRIQYPGRRDGHYYWISYIISARSDNHDESNLVIIVNNGADINIKTVVEDLKVE